VHANWDRIKHAEKSRDSVTDGVPMGQPALTLAAALQRKAARLDLPADLAAPPAAPAPATAAGSARSGGPTASAASDLGRRLWSLVADARAAGLDPEAELRHAARAFRDTLAAAERAARAAGRDPATLVPAEWRSYLG